MSAVTTASDAGLGQRMAALERANHVRVRRAEMKRDLRAGRTHPAALVSDPPEWLSSMTALDMMLAVPMCGRVKAVTVLRRAGVAGTRTLGALTVRQRAALVDELGSVTRNATREDGHRA